MELQQFQNQAVIGQQFCAPYPIEITVQKRTFSFSGGDFKILDSNGNQILTVDGQLLSLHQRWEAYRGEKTSQDNLLFTVGKSSVFQLRISLEVQLGSNAHVDFQVKGRFLARSCTIYQGTAIIAEMKPKRTISNVFWGRDVFVVTVNPGVDYAFVVALVVILDGIKKQEKAQLKAVSSMLGSLS